MFIEKIKSFGMGAVNLAKKTGKAVVNTAKKCAGAVVTGCGTVGAMVGLNKTAQAQVTLPDLGFDVSEYATAMGTDLGTVFVTILGIAAVFIIGKIGWRWLKRAGS